MAQRYYWLKLDQNFFESKIMKKIRRLAGGDTYCVVYLRMILSSAKNDGFLFFDGIEEDFASELALDLGEPVDTIKAALNIFVSSGLVEQTSETVYKMTEFENMTGSETKDAERMRKRRKGKKTEQISEQCSGNTNNVQKRSTEKEKEEDKEKEKEEDAEATCAHEKEPDGTQPPPDPVFSLLSQNGVSATPFVCGKINQYRARGCADDLIVYAIEQMLSVGAKSLNYIHPILLEAIAQGAMDATSFAIYKGNKGNGRNTAVSRATQIDDFGKDISRPRRLKRED